MKFSIHPSYTPNATDLLYHEIPRYYTLTNKKTWKRRKNVQNNKAVGRIHMVSPAQGDLYYFRLLLLHVKGATSFEDMKSYNDTVYHI